MNCSDNDITSIDVTQNTALIDLRCEINDLTSIDVTQNTALTHLYCWGNYQLTSLDVTQNTTLAYLSCHSNQITSIDVSQNTALTYLSCASNPLTSIDVSQNTALTILYCGSTQLTSLDVTQNTALTELFCFLNQLTSLDITQNTALAYLKCGYNQLTNLDVTQNTALFELVCEYNNLFCLNVKNGNNSNFTSFHATDNPSLTCIEVDNVAWSTANWTDIDPQTSFSTNCNNSCSATSINKTASNTFELYPNPTTSTITLNNLQLGDEVSVYNTLGQRVYSSQVSAVTLSINLSELGNNGIYFVRVNNISERVLLSR